MTQTFDVAIIGAGVSGAFAWHKLLKNNKKLKIAIFDAGRSPGKRKHQIFGFLGAFPNSDGKLYVNDLPTVSNVAGHTKTINANKWVMDQLSNVVNLKLIKDRKPSGHAEKRFKKYGFEIELNNYYQLYPKDAHAYSRVIMNDLDKNPNTFCSFDNEVYKIYKHKNYFTITTSEGEFQSQKLLISVGRGGWRWASELFNNFGIIENNDTARFGIRIEMPSTHMRDFNQSNCTLTQNLVEVGPLSWEGSVLPEDHIDFAMTAFRSNETRWYSDKVSFNVIANKHCQDNGYQQMDRIGKLAFILGNDRMIKEKLSTIMNKKSKISVLNEYDFLIPFLEELDKVMPDLIKRAAYYAPTLMPYPPTVRLTKNFETEIEGMYVAGESANVSGILGAAVSGCISADSMIKGI